jgi:nucleoside 2-deoxyribosyltransferase
MHGTGTCGENHAAEERQARVFRVNRQRIEKADIVFAYISEPDCYGTLTELGFARARGKHIVVAFSDKLPLATIDDMWVAQLCANAPILRGPARLVWQAFISRQVYSTACVKYRLRTPRPAPTSEIFQRYIGATKQ